MKKLFSLMAAMFLLGGFLLVPLSASAVSNLDQHQDDGTAGGNSISGHKFVGQSFIPTQNRLNKISLYLKGTDTVYMQMTKTGENTLLLPNGGPSLVINNNATYAWYDFSFTEVAVTPGESYTVWIASYGNTYWGIYPGPDSLYSRGRAYIDCATWISDASCVHWISNADWAFRTYGYSVLTYVPIPVAPPSTPPANNPIGGTSAQATAKPTTTADTALAAPTLTTLKKGETSIVVPVKDTIEITQKGKLSLTGTSTEGAEVSVIFDGKPFPAVMETNGDWKIELTFENGKPAEYTIKAKTVKNGKSSSEAELFKIKLVESGQTITTAATKTWLDNLNMTYVLVAAGVLLIVMLILAYVTRHYHHQTKKSKPETKPEDKKKKEPAKEI